MDTAIMAIDRRRPAEARRVALVIGDSVYALVAVLPNAANDMRAVAAALKALDFEEAATRRGRQGGEAVQRVLPRAAVTALLAGIQ